MTRVKEKLGRQSTAQFPCFYLPSLVVMKFIQAGDLFDPSHIDDCSRDECVRPSRVPIEMETTLALSMASGFDFTTSVRAWFEHERLNLKNFF